MKIEEKREIRQGARGVWSQTKVSEIKDGDPIPTGGKPVADDTPIHDWADEEAS